MATRYQKDNWNKGQNALEYAALIIVLAAVILTVVWSGTGKRPLQVSLENAFTTVGDKIVHDIENTR